MSNTDVDVRQFAWMLVNYTDIKTGDVIRKIPYRYSYVPSKAGSTTKILVFDTKKFKLKGERRFTSQDKIDPWSFFSVIEIQGFQEGWYDPRKINSNTEPSSREQILEKYLQYNDWFKSKGEK